MPNRVFVISDTHFGHNKEFLYGGNRGFSSIEKHDDELVYRWNHTVKKHDTVWHLGDVLFGLPAFDTLSRLNGNKVLVMGNHDSYPMHRYLEHFNKVFGAVRLRECLLTHVPVHPCQLGRFKGNIHGHMHHTKMDDPRYFNVCAEHVGLTPVLMDTIILRIGEANDLLEN